MLLNWFCHRWENHKYFRRKFFVWKHLLSLKVSYLFQNSLCRKAKFCKNVDQTEGVEEFHTKYFFREKMLTQHPPLRTLTATIFHFKTWKAVIYFQSRTSLISFCGHGCKQYTNYACGLGAKRYNKSNNNVKQKH